MPALKEIAELVGGEVIGDDQVLITGIHSLVEASTGEISFFGDPRYKESLKETKASALLVSAFTELYAGPQVLVPNPALAYARVATLFAPPPPRFSGKSEKAFIHKTARIGEDVSIYPFVYVGEEAMIGDHTTLCAGVFVGDRVRIGNSTVIHPNVSILHDSVIGNEVIIHAGSVIGSDGFGFVRDGQVNVKIPQIGYVQIDDQVEIGANNTIDRAALGKTWIKRGVKTDNLVQIAHNVVIGEDTVIVALTGISGSSNIGREVVIGGQVGINDHITIGDRAMIGSQSGVAKSVSPGQVVTGRPAMPHRLWLRTTRVISRLPEIYDRLRRLEKKVEDLEIQPDKVSTKE
ncbi:MAG: UDP-3-O-(3-hydroxymyristoyl)glucosamine N-acyltransferase [Desulfobacteraceae bacterium]